MQLEVASAGERRETLLVGEPPDVDLERIHSFSVQVKSR
jgi:hypothetical protein